MGVPSGHTDPGTGNGRGHYEHGAGNGFGHDDTAGAGGGKGGGSADCYDPSTTAAVSAEVDANVSGNLFECGPIDIALDVGLCVSVDSDVGLTACA
jgi:hypothetical protein